MEVESYRKNQLSLKRCTTEKKIIRKKERKKVIEIASNYFLSLNDLECYLSFLL